MARNITTLYMQPTLLSTHGSFTLCLYFAVRLAGVSLGELMFRCTGRAASAAVWQEHNAGARLWRL